MESDRRPRHRWHKICNGRISKRSSRSNKTRVIRNSLKRREAALSDLIDRIIAWLKWPAAILALMLLPGTMIGLLELLVRVVTRPLPVMVFLVGFAVYFVIWWWLFRRSRFAFVMTLEHELTHALFALVTFHRVIGLRATAFRGGEMRFVGKGNWLITVAPYFFPTMSLSLLAVSWFLPRHFANVANFMVGGSFAYHIISTLRETHPGQTDLQKAGFGFCLCFLPTANMITFGLMLAFIYGGGVGSKQFLGAICRKAWELFT